MISDRSKGSGEAPGFELRVFLWSERRCWRYLTNLSTLMKFFDLCKPTEVISVLVEVWLEAGREGRTFTYSSEAEMGLEPGDLVKVRLRGRPMHGLVVADQEGAWADASAPFNADLIQPVEALVLKAAVPSEWRLWIEASAQTCHLSAYRMLKAALPAGWLGEARKPIAGSGRGLWWIRLATVSAPAEGLPERQQALLSHLKEKHPNGAWQRDLGREGFTADLLRRLEARGFVVREQRRPLNPLHQPCRTARAAPDPHPRATRGHGCLCSDSPRPWTAALGDTRSGKTEMYLHLVADELAKGHHALLLTPEIGLIRSWWTDAGDVSDSGFLSITVVAVRLNGCGSGDAASRPTSLFWLWERVPRSSFP